MATNNSGNTTLDLVEYYSNLLVSQYQNKPKAVATVQTSITPIIMPGTTVETIAFNPIPTGGSFTLTYDDTGSFVTINWNDSAGTIQGLLSNLPPGTLSGGSPIEIFSETISGGGPSTVTFDNIINGGTPPGWLFTGITVTGSIASGLLTVTFNGVQPPAALLAVGTNSLTPPTITITIEETDQTMPLAVLNGFNLF